MALTKTSPDTVNEHSGPGTVAELVKRAADGERFEYVCFWGHQPRRDGTVGAERFSQWWPAPFTIDEVAYATAEHWMMAGKARLFSDAEAEQRAIGAAHPGQAKKAGRSVRGCNGAVWHERRFELAVRGSVAEFEQHPALRDYLLGAGTRVLVETSPVDRVWGIGLAAAGDRTVAPEQWQGLNLLGFALMEARHRLA
ncbi:NADAR family protein [Streptomyces zagrosensis]|uniref:NADAR domain-containing protein n=1 Tax=Streptomyces zagrosensis TaxID=1042984 RepID=A0A7W9UYK3_9ACTN|nr:NADAR family protein [Streptomyces zagrosensis]MBB5936033.1 hypothetical protein [Streptomyces zagrosensis]